MDISLKAEVNRAHPQEVIINLNERLPERVLPCTMSCQYQVEAHQDFYLMQLAIQAHLKIICQRCLQVFDYTYMNELELAICPDEATAEKILEHYETIVAQKNQIDLTLILTDELHLGAPHYHTTMEDCDSEISQYIGSTEA